MRSLSFAILLGLLGVIGAHAAAPSVTGPFLPGMDQVDAKVVELMNTYACPGAELAITYQGRLVLARGYGMANVETGASVQPDSRMRVASLSKFVTSLAVLTLAQQGRLDLDAPAFALIPQLTPLPGATVDPRLKTITVRQLLQHTGGWNPAISGDPMFNSEVISTAAGTPPPASADTIIRYMLGRPLDFDPGTQFAYANFGYCVLGRIIEAVTGQSYGDYVQGAVFSPAGISRAVLGQSLPANRAPGEVSYYDYPGAPLVNSVFPPTSSLVPRPDGGFCLESADSAGGWVMNAIDYVRLWAAVDATKPPALLDVDAIAALTARPAPPVSVGVTNYYALGLQAEPVNSNTLTGATFWHEGGVSGTSTFEFHLYNGWTFAILFNTQPQQLSSFEADIGNGLAMEIENLTPPASGDLYLTAKPEIIAPPSSQAVELGGAATLTAVASSVTAPAYQWFKDGTAIPGASGPTLSLSNITAADLGSYFVVVTNSAGATVSGTATLGFPGVPSITVPPSAQTIANGSTVVFNLSASTGPAPSYQWFLNSVPIPGATGPELVVPNANAGAAGNYTCTITNPSGSATSLAARLNVVSTSNPGRLVDLSCRTGVGTGSDILIAGFSVGGAGTSGTEPLLIRGSGPALVPFGVSGVLPDPRLTLFSGTSVLGVNNGWEGSAAIAGAAAAAGAFPWNVATSLDAALLGNLPGGPFTAQIEGQAGDAGVALVEVYDEASPGSRTAASPRLVNLSARAQVGTGAGTLIAGFVLGGATAKTVLIRAAGPSLAAFGILDTLPDPELKLYSGSTELASNSGWGGNADIAYIGAAVGAFAWTNASSHDSAILVTLPPGAYTAQVAGSTGDTGVALVEVYEVP